MYESSLAKNLELATLESGADGMHISDTTFRFLMCHQQMSVERRFKAVDFQGVSFAQAQFEQNHFYGVNFADCSFSDVVFRGCVFLNTTFTGAVFSNSHFQNCVFIESTVAEGPIEAKAKFTNCLMMPGAVSLPPSAEREQNWIAGSAVPDKAPIGFSIFERTAPKQGVANPPNVSPEAILARQREAEFAIPDHLSAAIASATPKIESKSVTVAVPATGAKKAEPQKPSRFTGLETN